MNLTVSPINVQTQSSKNISSKGMFNKIFKVNKTPAKDVFVASATAAATVAGVVGLATASQTQNSEQNEKTMSRVFKNIRSMYDSASLLNNEFGNLVKNINEDLTTLPDNSTKDFINEVMTCISTSLDKDPKKLCSSHRFGDGDVMGKEGCFLLKTCQNLISLQLNPEDAEDKEFVAQVQKDVVTSKNLMQLINNDDWDTARKVDLESMAIYW